jgi:hypothetical protein
MQLLYNYFTKILRTRLLSTSNLIKHYTTCHKGVLTSATKERQLKKLDQLERLDFFKKYSFRIKTKDYIQKLILYIIVFNNLLLSLVESPSF